MAVSDSDRVKSQRKERIARGWQEVRVWVADQEAADEIREVARRNREMTERKHLNRLVDELASLEKEDVAAIVEAIIQQGSPAYITPSGPVLELLTDLAQKGAIKEMSLAYQLFAKARPGNSRFVASAIPAKLTANYFPGFFSYERFSSWEQLNPDWARGVQSALEDSEQFQLAVRSIVEGVRS